MAIIYKATNKLNGKSYIGQTTRSLRVRIKQHCESSSPCVAFKRALLKYGEQGFEWSILYESNTSTYLDFLEEYFIVEHNTLAPTGYNLIVGSTGKRIVSEETRLKMSLAQRGRTFSDESRRRMSESAKRVSNEIKRKNALGNQNRTGKKASDATKERISNSLKGRVLSEEHKRKISESGKGLKRKPFSEETKRKMSIAQRGNKNAKKLAISS